MKAYLLSLYMNDDAGAAVVFASTAREARKLIYGTTLGDSVEEWIDIRVHRDKRYDGMEGLAPAELAKIQWRDGWQWFDIDYPDPEEASDEAFMAWYEDVFGAKK